MNIALVQQTVTEDKTANVSQGLQALERAARRGAELVVYAELAFERFFPQRPAGVAPPWLFAIHPSRRRLFLARVRMTR